MGQTDRARPLHVACIMDGNGRWARRRGLPRTAGHTAGEENLAEIVRIAAKRDVGWLTVFGFSTENWVRPKAEVRHILGLHRRLFGRIEELNEHNVRVQWIGRPFDEPGSRTPVAVLFFENPTPASDRLDGYGSDLVTTAAAAGAPAGQQQ